MPQMYTVNVGARVHGGRRLLVPTVVNAAAFTITGSAVDSLLEKASPVLIPYEWRFQSAALSTTKSGDTACA